MLNLHTTVGCGFVSASFACNCAVIVATANAVAVGIEFATGCAVVNKPSGGVKAFPTRKRCPKSLKSETLFLRRKKN